jgi:hypothetical protein
MKLLTAEIEDPNVQENFKRIERAFEDQKMLKGSWQFFDLSFDQAIIKKPFAHNFKFIPKDVIQTYISGTGIVTWEYDSFDRNSIYVTTSGPVKVRAFVGLYNERSET